MCSVFFRLYSQTLLYTFSRKKKKENMADDGVVHLGRAERYWWRRPCHYDFSFFLFFSFSTVWLVNWPSKKKSSAIHTQQEYGSEAWGRFVSPTESWFLYQTTYSTQCLFLFISRNQLTASLSTIELECYFWTICRVDLLPVKDKFVVSSDNIIQCQNHCFPCLYTIVCPMIRFNTHARLYTEVDPAI